MGNYPIIPCLASIIFAGFSFPFFHSFVVVGVFVVALLALVYAVMQRGAQVPVTESELDIALPAPEDIPEQT